MNGMNFGDVRRNIKQGGLDSQRSSLKAMSVLESLRESMQELTEEERENPELRERHMNDMQRQIENAISLMDNRDADGVRRQIGAVLLSATMHMATMEKLNEEGTWSDEELGHVSEMVVGLSVQIADTMEERLGKLFSAAYRDENDSVHWVAAGMQAGGAANKKIFSAGGKSENDINRVRTLLTHASLDLGVELCINCAHAALEASTKLKQALDDDMNEVVLRTMVERVVLEVENS